MAKFRHIPNVHFFAAAGRAPAAQFPKSRHSLARDELAHISFVENGQFLGKRGGSVCDLVTCVCIFDLLSRVSEFDLEIEPQYC